LVKLTFFYFFFSNHFFFYYIKTYFFDEIKQRVHEAYFVSNLREKMQHENSQQEEALKKLSEAQSESDKKFYTQQAKDFEEKAKVWIRNLSIYFFLFISFPLVNLEKYEKKKKIKRYTVKC